MSGESYTGRDLRQVPCREQPVEVGQGAVPSGSAGRRVVGGQRAGGRGRGVWYDPAFVSWVH